MSTIETVTNNTNAHSHCLSGARRKPEGLGGWASQWFSILASQALEKQELSPYDVSCMVEAAV